MVEMTARGATTEALEALYGAELPRFVRTATAIVGDKGTGRDAVQDAFGQAVRRRASYKGEAPLEAWVWPIVIHEALAHRRLAAEVAWAPSRRPARQRITFRSRTLRSAPGSPPFPSASALRLSPQLSLDRSHARGRGRNRLGHPLAKTRMRECSKVSLDELADRTFGSLGCDRDTPTECHSRECIL